MKTYFSDFFAIDPKVLKRYGAFDVSLVTDLPLFIDPFLLFNSKKKKYRQLHDDIVRYLVFLRDKAQPGDLESGLLHSWYMFSEVKQNWLGFTVGGNDGRGLGRDFAGALHENLHRLFSNFGDEPVTKGSHLEKLCLVRDKVGRDNISDFTTNLIKDYLCEYTQRFAKQHLRADQIRLINVPRARFNYDTESWSPVKYELPWANGDFVLLTPRDILTKDDTWINKDDLVNDFEEIAPAIPDENLRAQVNNYFAKVLIRRRDQEPTKKDRNEAARQTILEFPALIDYFIRYKEDHGDEAEISSSDKVRTSEQVYINQIRDLQNVLSEHTMFYSLRGNTYAEAQERLEYLRDVIENKGGHKIFYIKGKPLERETDLHVMYHLVWFGTPSDVSREVNDGRGPADFKISRGAKDKTIVEFKLAKNTGLEKNLLKQVEIYKKASDAEHSLKAILYFTEEEFNRAVRILKKLELYGHQDIYLIDGRNDNKPSGSKAT